MSRAFTKEDSWEEPIVPPRAPLPEGVPNYVTPRGLALLKDEQASLEAERVRLVAAGDDERAKKALVVLARRAGELADRIASAQVVAPLATYEDVRFGARVTLRDRAGKTRTFRIVGVDESDPDAGSISFAAPIARAVLGKRVGETATLRTAAGEETLEVVAIEGATPAS
jgi:transcription elongation factor GreB